MLNSICSEFSGRCICPKQSLLFIAVFLHMHTIFWPSGTFSILFGSSAALSPSTSCFTFHTHFKLECCLIHIKVDKWHSNVATFFAMVRTFKFHFCRQCAIHIVIRNLKINKHYLIYRNSRILPQKSTSTQLDLMLHITKLLLLDPLLSPN